MTRGKAADAGKAGTKGRGRAASAKSAPTDELLERAAEQFRALAEPARLRILRRLMAGEALVGELAEELGSSQANASKHVAVLAAVGFVARRKDGPAVVCSLGDEVVRELCTLMCERAVERAEQGLRLVRA